MLLVDGRRLTLAEIGDAAEGTRTVSASREARTRMARSRAAIDAILKSGEAVYGVNTGFGKLSDVRIADADLANLQHNLLRSHACGVGPPLSREETRAMLLLRANVLARGHSGARPEVLETLLAMLERGVTPVVPEKGSVGASGDLAPLAHLALVAIGEGEAWGPNGERVPGDRAMADAGIPPLTLEPKEGLALLNGTQAMVAVGALALRRAWVALRSANRIGAMTLEALKGTPAAFDARIHDARGHVGQNWVAADLRALLAESEIRESHRSGDPRVQDAYSLRCMPQVHGAVWQALNEATRIVEAETGASTDNPLVFVDPVTGTAEVLSGGNFHGAPVALALDYAAIALTDLLSISERRVDRLVNPDLNEGLPAFLTHEPGRGSGFMMPHVTMVALLNEARGLAHPASVDNAPTSGGKEDHVSMGMHAAVKLRRLVENVELGLAIEALTAAEGLEYRKPLLPGVGVREAVAVVRAHAAALDADRALGPDIERLAAVLRSGALVGAVEPPLP